MKQTSIKSDRVAELLPESCFADLCPSGAARFGYRAQVERITSRTGESKVEAG